MILTGAVMGHRKTWEDAHGKLPKGIEIHHKIPRHAGGTDDLSNLIPLTPIEHRNAHLKRYQELGDFRDLAAYHMICHNFTDAHLVSSAAGGRVGGVTTKAKGIGIFRSVEERKAWAAMGGTAAQATLKSIGKSAFYDPVLKAQISSKGGLASSAFRDADAQSARGKRGGKFNRGKLWVTDGKTSFKYLPTAEQPIEAFLSNNPHLKRGRHCKEKTT